MRSVQITEKTAATVEAYFKARDAARPVPKRREQDIQRAILDLLHARGVVAWKAGAGGFRVTSPQGRERYVRMGHTGVADIIGLLPGSGRFCAVEVKTSTGAVTPAQQLFLDSVSAAGGLAVVARSVADVVKAFGWDGR